VKQIILKMLVSFGYVLLRADAWQDMQRRLRAVEVTKSKNESETMPPPPPTPTPAPAPQLEGELTECRNQLAACASERHLLNVQMGRAQASVNALQRERSRLQGELAASREQLDGADPTGRIQELEAEKRRLQQRLFDLEVYLKETRGRGASYL
jgi:septal ring factor EnvC (AmiA/AmiB activator)